MVRLASRGICWRYCKIITRRGWERCSASMLLGSSAACGRSSHPSWTATPSRKSSLFKDPLRNDKISFVNSSIWTSYKRTLVFILLSLSLSLSFWGVITYLFVGGEKEWEFDGDAYMERLLADEQKQEDAQKQQQKKKGKKKKKKKISKHKFESTPGSEGLA